jgi:hypothetical protein
VETKEGRNGCLSLHGAFHLGPKLLHGSNGQFLTALSEVTAFNGQFTMFYKPVSRLSSSSFTSLLNNIKTFDCFKTNFPPQNLDIMDMI